MGNMDMDSMEDTVGLLLSLSKGKGKSILGPQPGSYSVKDTLLAMHQIQERLAPATSRLPSIYDKALEVYRVDRINALGNDYHPAVAAVAALREHGEPIFKKAKRLADFRNADPGYMKYSKHFSVDLHNAVTILDDRKARQLTVDLENSFGIIDGQTGFLLPSFPPAQVHISDIRSEAFLRHHRSRARINLADSRTKRMEHGNWKTHDEEDYQNPPCKLERQIYRYQNPVVPTSYSSFYTEAPSRLGSMSCRLVSQQVVLPQMITTHINGPSWVAGILFISAIYFHKKSLKNLNFEFARVDTFSNFIEF